MLYVYMLDVPLGTTDRQLVETYIYVRYRLVCIILRALN